MLQEIAVAFSLLNSMMILFLIFRTRKLQGAAEKTASAVASMDGLTVHYYPDIKKEKNWLSSQERVQIKMQIYFKELPVGQPSVLTEFTTKEVDVERIDAMVKAFADPVLKLGLQRVVGL